jgi:hypothetical protein
MRFWIEWMLAVHRAVWFPFNWATGLERPGIALPVELAPAMLAPPAERPTAESRLKASRRGNKAKS